MAAMTSLWKSQPFTAEVKYLPVTRAKDGEAGKHLNGASSVLPFKVNHDLDVSLVFCLLHRSISRPKTD